MSYTPENNYGLTDTLDERATILDVLEKAPDIMAWLGKIVVMMDRDKRAAQDELDRSKARTTKAHKEERNMDIIKAYVDDDENVVAAKAKVLKAWEAWKMVSNEFDRIERFYISARKIGSMNDTEMRVLHTRIGAVVTEEIVG